MIPEDRGGMRREANAVTQLWRDHSGAGFERMPSPCLSGQSHQTYQQEATKEPNQCPA